MHYSKRLVLCHASARSVSSSDTWLVISFSVVAAVLDFPGGPSRSRGESTSVYAGVSTPRFMICIVANATVGIFGMGYDALHRQMEEEE
jgi:hypothetical protein